MKWCFEHLSSVCRQWMCGRSTTGSCVVLSDPAVQHSGLVELREGQRDHRFVHRCATLTADDLFQFGNRVSAVAMVPDRRRRAVQNVKTLSRVIEHYDLVADRLDQKSIALFSRSHRRPPLCSGQVPSRIH